MTKVLSIKNTIRDAIMELLNEKIGGIAQSIASTRESQNSETKCSAGDKFETSRAMMQQELDQLEAQLSKNQILKAELSRIDLTRNNGHADLGSLVITNRGSYFLSIGLGKIDIDNGSYFCISLASPIGQLLYLKKKGDSFVFQDNTYTILDIT